MKKCIATILVVLFSLFFTACRHQPGPEPAEQLPPETHKGLNTLGFNLNGKVWLPKGKPSYGPGPLRFVVEFESFSIRAQHLNQYLTIEMDEPFFEGVYNVPGIRLRVVFDDNTTIYTIVSGSLNVKFRDYTKNITSGTFSFKGKSESGEEITIEDGRFDVSFF